MQMGIVGLPNVGKSTLFNTLGKVSIPAENFPFCTIEPNNVCGFLPIRLHCCIAKQCICTIQPIDLQVQATVRVTLCFTNVVRTRLFTCISQINLHCTQARVHVPDQRFKWLCSTYSPKSEVPAFLDIVDIAGLVK